MYQPSLGLSKLLCKKTLVLVILFLMPLLQVQLYAQFKATKVTRSNNLVVLDGKKYYMHEVKAGHTLYSVSKAYNVSQKVISRENPNVPHISTGTLPLGAVIRIPFVEIIQSSLDTKKDFDKYYYHIVEPKETLSSLSRQYKIHYKIIIENNPGVENKLPIGLEVKIPKTQVSAIRETTYTAPDTTFIYHKVKKGQNTIRVANLYGIRVRDLRKANPGIRWGLNENEIIRIPKHLITKKEMIPIIDEGINNEEIVDEVVDEVVELDENALKDIETNTNPDCLDYLRPHDDQIFEVAFLLPLYLETNDTLHINDTVPFSPYDIYDDDVRFLDFIEGAYIAIDSLRESGLSMNITIHDTENDGSVVNDLFESGKLNGSDLIIGPVFSEPLRVASYYAKNLQIPLVSPFSSRGTGMDENPYLFQVNSGKPTQYELSSLYLSNFYNMNIIMVQDTINLQPVRREYYSEKIVDYLAYRIYPEDFLTGKIQFHPTFSESLPEKEIYSPLKDMLSLGRKNLIIIPSDNDIFVTDLINNLNALSLHYDITVFGRPEWGSNEALELEYLYNLKLHYYTNFSNPYVNYSDSLTLSFCEKYRSNWHNEPSRFSFQGFDVTYYFFRALYLFGNDFVKSANCLESVLTHPTLQTEFSFHHRNGDRGFENQALSIVRYNPVTLTKEKIKSTLASRNYLNPGSK